MLVTNSSLTINTPPSDQKTPSGDTPFGQIFEQALSKPTASQPESPPTIAHSQEKAPISTQPTASHPHIPFSTAEHGLPGSPPGFQEALHSLVNQPNLTNEERIQICVLSAAALSYARNGPPEMAAKFPEYAGAYSEGFNPVRALLSTVNSLAARYPNLAQVGKEWAASQASM